MHSEERITLEASLLATECGLRTSIGWYIWANMAERDCISLLSNKRVKYEAEGPMILDTHFMNWDYVTVLGAAITKYELHQWLREKHNMDVEITSYYKHGKKVYSQEVYYGEFTKTPTGRVRKTVRKNSVYITYETYEEALDIGMIEALKEIQSCT